MLILGVPRWFWLALIAALLVVGAAVPFAYFRLGFHQDPLPHQPTRYSDGHYSFQGEQARFPGVPVGFNPCQGVPVYVNYDQAPGNALRVVQTSIKRINQASGLKLHYVGAIHATMDHPVPGGITVSFRNAGYDGELGVSGQWRWTKIYGRYEYAAQSTVTFNLAEMAGRSDAYWQAVSDHEFGHAVGLGHVNDPKELMFPVAIKTGHYGHGDLTGLAVLGALPCS